MKIFSLTDVETPELKRRGWVGLPIVVGSALIAPGGEAEVGDVATIRRDLVSFIVAGALAVGSRPPEYAVAKAKALNRERLASLEQDARGRRKER
jgi:hypothetical protein